jgi:hypothetical protein
MTGFPMRSGSHCLYAMVFFINASQCTLLYYHFFCSIFGFGIAMHPLSRLLRREMYTAGRMRSPILYKEYHEYSCPAPKHFADADGNCEIGPLNQPFLCESFCRVRTTFYYGRESKWRENFSNSAHNSPTPKKQLAVICPKWTPRAGAKPAGRWEALGTAGVVAVGTMR